MKEKKHIDELFKEQFKDFEATPSPQVWQNIQAKLKEEKKERKVIPLWWRVAGVAALLALLFTVGIPLLNTNDKGKTEVVTEETKPTIENPSENKNTTFEKSSPDTQVASEDNTDATNEVEKNSWKEKGNKTLNEDKLRNTPNSISNSNSNNAVASEENTSEKLKKSNRTNVVSEREGIAKNNSEGNNNSSENIFNKNTNGKANEGIAKNKAKEKANSNFKEGVSVSENEKTGIAKADNNTVESENKRSLLDVIKQEEEDKKDVALTKTTPQNRWQVTPNAGPVYYSSLEKGSSIDPMFADNSQSGDVNFSYGVQVSYQISDRLSIRSGINNVNVGYQTGDVEIASAPLTAALGSINYNRGAQGNVVTAFDRGTVINLDPGDGFGDINLKSTSGSALIIQDIKYYEVPLELNYALLNNRFGINMIGGVSTLFLGNNEISVESTEFSGTLGEANNLNQVSFSTNVGLGFNYKISKMFQFNVEPMFKYQLNPYTDSSVGFKPYYLGVYSGLSFKF